MMSKRLPNLNEIMTNEHLRAAYSDDFFDTLREQTATLAVLGMPVHHLWAFPPREIGGGIYRQVHAFTESEEIVFELRV
jgi:hypothetical protein